MKLTAIKTLNTFYIVFGIAAIILICIDGSFPIHFGGLARIGINIIVLILFSLTINQYLAKKNVLGTRYFQLQNDCENDQTNPKELFQRIFKYYNGGGHKTLYVETKEVIGLNWPSCDNFKAHLNHCSFAASPKFSSFYIRINDFKFKGHLLGVKFLNYTFEDVSFDAHCWGLKFNNCSFKNVDFSNTDTVTSSQFEILIGQVDNLRFYNTRVSSCRFISLNPPKFRDYKDSESIEKYLREFTINNKGYIEDWKGRFKFNSKTKVSDVSMSFDIYNAINEENNLIINHINIDPYSRIVTINPTYKSLPVYTP